MELKDIFGSEAITYDQFLSKLGKSKFVDLNDGQYVSINKYNDLNAQINTLNETLASRDKDLADLKTKLTNAGADTEKLSTISTDLENLQKKYSEDIENYKAQIAKQAYEFAVKEFSNNYEFSSKAAKKEFVREMVNANLTMDEKGIVGAKDFYKRYAEENADSFIKKSNDSNKPHFTQPTGQDSNNGKKVSLTDMMKAKNLNPNQGIDF